MAGQHLEASQTSVKEPSQEQNNTTNVSRKRKAKTNVKQDEKEKIAKVLAKIQKDKQDKEDLYKRMNGKGQGLKELTALEYQTMVQDLLCVKGKKTKEEKMR